MLKFLISYHVFYLGTFILQLVAWTPGSQEAISFFLNNGTFFFRNPWHLFHMSINSPFGKGEPFKKNWKAIVQTVFLSHSEWASRFSSLPVEQVDDEARY